MTQLQTRNPVRDIAEQDYRPDLVRINENAIKALSPASNLESMGATLGESPLAASLLQFIPYFIVMDTQNYQFWDIDSQGEMRRYSRGGKVGALAMQESFHAAWLEAIGDDQGLAGPLLAPTISERLGARIAQEGVGFIFGDIPEAQSRKELLLEVLDPAKLSDVSAFLAQRIQRDGVLGFTDAELLASVFPKSYGDRYLKKAQLTLMFIAGQWNAQNPEARCKLDVCAAADYQLPKVARTMRLLDYSPGMTVMVDDGHLIAEDSTEERAIRAATVKVCDMVAEHFGVPIEEVDFWFWLNRNVDRDAKFHLTRTTAY